MLKARHILLPFTVLLRSSVLQAVVLKTTFTMVWYVYWASLILDPILLSKAFFFFFLISKTSCLALILQVLVILHRIELQYIID